MMPSSFLTQPQPLVYMLFLKLYQVPYCLRAFAHPRIVFYVFSGPTPLLYSGIKSHLTLLEKVSLITKIKLQQCPPLLNTLNPLFFFKEEL